MTIAPNVAVSVLVVLDVEPGAGVGSQFVPTDQSPGLSRFQVASAAWTVDVPKRARPRSERTDALVVRKMIFMGLEGEGLGKLVLIPHDNRRYLILRKINFS